MDLPIATSKGQGRELFPTTEHFQHVINTCQWVGIFVGDFIQLIVNTKPSTAIFLFNYHDG